MVEGGGGVNFGGRGGHGQDVEVGVGSVVGECSLVPALESIGGAAMSLREGGGGHGVGVGVAGVEVVIACLSLSVLVKIIRKRKRKKCVGVV